MNNKAFRTAISNQCGFNKAKHRQDLQVKLSPERLAKLESICQRHPAKQGEKTQPQRLLESIISEDSLETEPITPNESRETGDDICVFIDDWPRQGCYQCGKPRSEHK